MSRRMFIAFKLPAVIKSSMLSIQNMIKENTDIESVKWVHADNMHITIAFLGQVPDNALESIEEAIDKTHFRPLLVSGGEIGFFSKRKIPSIMHVKPRVSDEMDKCANELRAHLSERNIDFDRKPFAPHITLARFRNAKSGLNVYDYVNNKLDRYVMAEYTIDSIVLYESRFTRQGPVYIKIYQK